MRTFETENLDLSSYLVTTGYQPDIFRNTISNRAVLPTYVDPGKILESAGR
ncbi:hypothetical protein JN12_00084 [Geobacter argillaceus]|uniref:Uncharacterized protein n=1 Tax=Geobacter argillaceus TaxID=345631 RepID=A0A562WSY3_9BACT|nr:hypothetical protein JN12_00084 [Geobacter argillaceus]